MYSADRRHQLEQTISFLEKMDGFEACQKTIVFDGDCLESVPGFEVVRVPRIGGVFCWARMWDAGVATARHPIVWYLDSDRLLPKNYIRRLVETVGENNFVYTSHHYMVIHDLGRNFARFLEDSDPQRLVVEDEFQGRMIFEPRYSRPLVGPGKSVMSGNTAFLKSTFFKLGGVDPWYCGHGAYADTDFLMTANVRDCKFVDLELPELHCHHHKFGENNIALSATELHRLNLDNFVYYLLKWKLPLQHAETIAKRIGLNPGYVSAKVKEFSKG
jgi:hypothetical protein